MTTIQNPPVNERNEVVQAAPSSTQSPQISTENSTKNKKFNFLLPILIVVLIAVAWVVYYVYKSTQPQEMAEIPQLSSDVAKKSPSPSSQPVRTPIPLYPDNGTKGTYNVSQGKHDGPAFSQVIFDPLNAQKDQILTITVTFKEKGSVTGLTGTLKSDSSSTNVTFQKVESAQTETWQTSFTLNDSVLYNYILTLTATGSSGSSSMTIAPRS